VTRTWGRGLPRKAYLKYKKKKPLAAAARNGRKVLNIEVQASEITNMKNRTLGIDSKKKMRGGEGLPQDAKKRGNLPSLNGSAEEYTKIGRSAYERQAVLGGGKSAGNLVGTATFGSYIRIKTATRSRSVREVKLY